MPTLDEEQALMEKSKELLIYVIEKGFLARGTSGILGAALKVMDEKAMGADGKCGCRDVCGCYAKCPDAGVCAP